MAVLSFKVTDNATAEIAARLAQGSKKAEHEVAIKVKADTERYVPFLTGSQANRTLVTIPHDHLSDRAYTEGNTIVYPGPYARYLYYGKVMVEAGTGRGPMRIVDKLGNEYIRFHNGAKLVPTARPLNYSTDAHPEAGPRWFERSKSQNLQTWLETAQRAVTKLG